MPAPRSLNVPLPGPTAEALFRLAQAERRHPRDQATVLLERALGIRFDADAEPPGSDVAFRPASIPERSR